jgi:acetyl esterase
MVVEMADEDASARFGPRRLLWSSAVAAVTGGVVVMFATSARASALVFRGLLEHSSRAASSPSERSLAGVGLIADEQYEPGEPDARLDVYFPSSVATGERLPTIIWIHGGAWISGAKDVAAPYFEMLARGGVSLIAVEYSRAPEAQYPAPILQINDAIAYVQRHAERFHVDEEQVIVAGDSAGAQMASQIATLVTNPAYALEVGIVPTLRPDRLRGAILFCGVYDAAGVARHPRVVPNTAFRLLTRTVLWAYTGSRERDSAALLQMSTIDHVTSAFPPTFISGGNGDPLTDVHSRPFAARLAGHGVDVTARFFPDEHTPAQGHEYQFRIESTDGQDALRAVLEFVERIKLPSR